MIEIVKCPLCDSKEILKKFRCKDHSVSQEFFNIVSCETCQFTFTSPAPEKNEIGKYYDSEKYISHTNSSKGFFNWMYQTVRKYTIRRKVLFLKSLTNKGTHLDVGCGTGEFLSICKKEGFKVEGVEPAEKARKKAIKKYNLSVSKNASLTQYENESFHSISMWHSLEHMPDPAKTISEISKILKKEGVVIVALPNHQSWDAHYYKENWAAWDVPIHFCHFSKKTITHLFKKNQFDLIKTKAMVFDSYYVSMLSEEFISGKKKFAKSIFIGLMSNIIGRLTKRGHSSMIYVFKKSSKAF